VLVLGGSGFIGAQTARALHTRGASVIVTGRDPERIAKALGPISSLVHTVITDLAEPGAAARLIDETSPALVFNLAGYGVDRSERAFALMTAINARMVKELCTQLATRSSETWSGVKLVHVGSALEYGRIDGPLHETAKPQPTTDYGRTKLEGTLAVQACCNASGFDAIVARLFTVYGPGDYPEKLLPSLLRTARSGAPLRLSSGRQRRNFVYVEDVVEGLLRLSSCRIASGQIVNLATDHLTSVREFAELAADVLGIDRALLEFGALPDRDDEMWHGEVDVSRLLRLTAWLPPTSIAEGIRRSRESADVG
jgi:nucleoside-diphosphate-sugar epimerase